MEKLIDWITQNKGETRNINGPPRRVARIFTFLALNTRILITPYQQTHEIDRTRLGRFIMSESR